MTHRLTSPHLTASLVLNIEDVARSFMIKNLPYSPDMIKLIKDLANDLQKHEAESIELPTGRFH